ncbi:hypothetical protein L9F63_021304, partial [Diploptera punctata]
IIVWILEFRISFQCTLSRSSSTWPSMDNKHPYFQIQIQIQRNILCLDADPDPDSDPDPDPDPGQDPDNNPISRSRENAYVLIEKSYVQIEIQIQWLTVTQGLAVVNGNSRVGSACIRRSLLLLHYYLKCESIDLYILAVYYVSCIKIITLLNGLSTIVKTLDFETSQIPLATIDFWKLLDKIRFEEHSRRLTEDLKNITIIYSTIAFSRFHEAITASLLHFPLHTEKFYIHLTIILSISTLMLVHHRGSVTMAMGIKTFVLFFRPSGIIVKCSSIQIEGNYLFLWI